jgi:hypothetical protein
MRRRTLYFTCLILAFICAALFCINLPFPWNSATAFHLDTWPVTWHLIDSLFVIGVLLRLLSVAWEHYRITVDVRHQTTISQK